MSIILSDFHCAKKLFREDEQVYVADGMFKARPPEMFNLTIGYNAQINLYALGLVFY